MRMNLIAVSAPNGPQDCFGEFDKENRLCASYCILRLRCAIEQEHNLRSALLEEWLASEQSMGKIQ